MAAGVAHPLHEGVKLRMERRATVERLIRAVLDSAGTMPAAERAAVFRGEGMPGPLAGYVALVRTASYRITDADIARLRDGGVSEDAILEVTLAATLGAAAAELDDGLRALESD